MNEYLTSVFEILPFVPFLLGTYAAVIAGGVAVTGTLVSGYAAKKAADREQSRSLGEVGDMPVGDYADQLRSLAKAQFEFNRQTAEQTLEYAPRFAGAEREAQLRAGKALLSIYPEFAGAERRETKRQRQSDLRDLRKLGPKLEAELEALSPAYAALDETATARPSALLDKLNLDALSAEASPLRLELERQALYDLNLRGALSPEEERAAQQSAREAWSARGLGTSSPAALSEVLNRDVYARARERERRAFAGQAWQVGETEDLNERAFGTNVENLNQADVGNRFNRLLAGGQAKLNPILAMLGRRTATSPLGLLGAYPPTSAALPAQVMGTAPQITGASAAIAPLYNYGQDVYDTNFNAAEARALNEANAMAQLGAGVTSAAGSIYGSYMRGQPARQPTTARGY